MIVFFHYKKWKSSGSATLNAKHILKPKLERKYNYIYIVYNLQVSYKPLMEIYMPVKSYSYSRITVVLSRVKYPPKWKQKCVCVCVRERYKTESLLQLCYQIPYLENSFLQCPPGLPCRPATSLFKTSVIKSLKINRSTSNTTPEISQWQSIQSID